jgi:Mg2+ and Co2+ transporter CorA
MNSLITVLTLFSAFLLPLTLITSFYWMNIKLPFSDNPILIFFMLGFSVITMLIFYIYFKRKGSV